MTFDRVTPGAPIKFSARKENATVDLLNAAARGGLNGVSPKVPPQTGTDFLVRNESGSDRNGFTIMQVTGLASDPTGNENGFLESPVLIVDDPDSDGATSCVVMLQQTTGGTSPFDGRIGLARLAGAAPVKVDFQKTTHRFAIPVNGDPTKLKSALAGPFEILFPRPAGATGVQWAMVRFPHTERIVIRAKPDADVTSGSSGTFSVYSDNTDTTENVTGHYDWATDGETLLSGTEGWLGWDADLKRWEWLGGACAP